MFRRQFGSSLLGFCSLALLGLVGCSSSQSVGVGQPEGVASVARGAHPRVAQDVLAANGLEDVYNPPRDVDAGVHSVELAGDALLISSMPAKSTKGNLHLLNRADLHTRWYFETTEALKLGPTTYTYPAGSSAPANEVYFSQLDTVYCVDLKYGDLLWRQKLDFPISTRVFADDRSIFVGSDNGRVYGLRKNSKIEAWTHRTGGGLKAAPAADATSVYFGSTDGQLYKFSGVTGWVHGSSWSFATGARIIADPVIFSRWVLVGSTDYKLYCLEATDGTVQWAFQTEAPIEEAPVVYSHKPNQEVAYVVSTARSGGKETRTLFSIKMSDGQPMWQARGMRKVVALGKNNLYVLNDAARAADRAVIALDLATGQEKFRIGVAGFDFVPTNSADFRQPKERGRIYLVAEDGTVQVLRERL